MLDFSFQWLSQTVLARVVQEIMKINRDLERLGSDDVRIGGKSLRLLHLMLISSSAYYLSLKQNYLIFIICKGLGLSELVDNTLSLLRNRDVIIITSAYYVMMSL